MIGADMEPHGWVDRYAVPAAAAAAVVCWATIVAILGPGIEDADDVLSVVVAGTTIVTAMLGWRIVHLDPGNEVGRRLTWLALTLTAMWTVAGAVEAGMVQDTRPEELWVRWAVLLDDVSFVFIFLAAASVLLVFPDGRAPTAAWAQRARWWNRLIPALVVITWFGHDEIEVEGEPGLPAVRSPLPGWEPLQILWLPALLLLVAVLVGTAIAVRGRYRRASGIERLQLSWLSYAAASVPSAILICIVEGVLVGSAGVVTTVAVGVAFLAIPVAVSIAVLRYRLYEIERLINRTLVYVALTAALGAAYAVIVLGVGVVLGGGTGWATAVATLVVAVAFRPARDRMQRAVDRRFARRRYEGLRLVEAFIDGVRAGTEEPERVGDVLARALHDRGLEVFFRLPATGGYADASGRLTALPEDLREQTPVHRGDLELGVVLHDPALRLRTDTFERMLRAACLPIEIARLRVEVRVQLAEVESSRARIVAAAAAERRKLERDLHDGAQQRLVALGMRCAMRRASSTPTRPAPAARSTPPSGRSPSRLPSCGRSPAACVRACWTATAWPARSPTSRAGRRYPSASRSRRSRCRRIWRPPRSSWPARR